MRKPGVRKKSDNKTLRHCASDIGGNTLVTLRAGNIQRVAKSVS